MGTDNTLTYYQQHKYQRCSYAQRYYKEHRQKRLKQMKQYNKKYYQKNRQKYLERQRQRRRRLRIQQSQLSASAAPVRRQTAKQKKTTRPRKGRWQPTLEQRQKYILPAQRIDHQSARVLLLAVLRK